MKILNIIPIIITLLFSGSCVTKFIPEIDEFESIIVVEGLLTNENITNYVKLSRTIPVGIAGISSPILGAHIIIRDDQNKIAILSESYPGFYVTDSLTFQGETGRTYKLHITANGELYESSAMLMRDVPPIDSLYSEFEFYDDGYIYPPLYSYQVYFDSNDPTNRCLYYRWTYEEVWEYHLPFHYPPPSKRICWVANKSSDILIKNTSALEMGLVRKFPLVYLDNRSSVKLSQKYSILLRQYSLNYEEYLYWENMRKMTEETGGLYDAVPMPLRGNISSINDPDRIALGFFSVSSVSTKRLFIKNDTIKMKLGGQYCVTDTLETLEGIAGIGRYIFVLEQVDGVGYLVSTYEQCADCTLSGTNIEPSFWNDDILK